MLHNPRAGDRLPVEGLLKALSAEGIDATCFSKREMVGFGAALATQPDLVIVAGGDGSVGRMLDFYAALTMPVAILPMGTANNIARSLGISGEALDVVSRLRTAPEKKLDIGVVNGPWGYKLFVEAVGFGLVAGLMTGRVGGRTIKETRARVRRKVIDHLRNAKAERIRISVDGTLIEDEVLFAEITSISRVGPALPLLDESRTADRHLDLITLAESARAEMVAWLKDDSADPPPVTIRKGRSFAASWARQPVRIDDKKIAKRHVGEDHVFARLLPPQIRVLVPNREGGGP
jgi:diacylglycerol kinase family enzyme